MEIQQWNPTYALNNGPMNTSYGSLDMKETHHIVVPVAIKPFQGDTLVQST